MLVFSDEQFDVFQETALEKACAKIARDLKKYRPKEEPFEVLLEWVKPRVRFAMRSFNLRQKRHLHLLCYWEIALGAERFAEFRETRLDAALFADGPEAERVLAARAALRSFLSAGEDE